MKRPQLMLECKIIAPKSMQVEVVNALHDQRVLHVLAHSKGEMGLDIGSTDTETEKIAELLVKARSILAAFPLVISKKDIEITATVFQDANKIIQNSYDEFISLQKAQKEISQIVQEEQKIKAHFEQLKFFDINPSAIVKAPTLHAFFGTVRKTEGLENTLRSLSSELSYRRNNEFVFVLTSKRIREKVKQILTTFSFDSFDINSISQNLDQEIVETTKKIEAAQLQQTKLDKKLIILKKSLSTVAGYEKALSIEAKKKELPLKFAVTKSSFLATGWVPAEGKDKLSNAIKMATEGKAFVDFSTPSHKSSPPVKLENNKATKPFEFFLDLYSLPKYGEIDPTILLSITFPLFFGYMLGDLGYGLVLVAVFLYIKKKVPSAKQIMNVLLFAAIVSSVFGIAFGEVFGFEHLSYETGSKVCKQIGLCFQQHQVTHHGVTEIIYEFPRVLARTHSHVNIAGFEILTVLVLGALVGLAHLNFGFLLGFINELKGHGFKHAILNKASWILLQLGIVGAILSYTNILTATMMYVSIGVMIISIIMLGVGEGIQGLVEIPALLSNALSYMRLGAVGLASVGLAVVVNENLALPFIEKGGIFIFVGIFIMLIGHAINILLGVIGPFLHSLRLHYVEFFSKFFVGGGVEYNPFGTPETENKNYSEEK